MIIIQFTGVDNYLIGLYTYNRVSLLTLSHQHNFNKCIEICKKKESMFYSNKINRVRDKIFDFKAELDIVLEEVGYTRVVINEQINTDYI